MSTSNTQAGRRSIGQGERAYLKGLNEYRQSLNPPLPTVYSKLGPLMLGLDGFGPELTPEESQDLERLERKAHIIVSSATGVRGEFWRMVAQYIEAYRKLVRCKGCGKLRPPEAMKQLSDAQTYCTDIRPGRSQGASLVASLPRRNHLPEVKWVGGCAEKRQVEIDNAAWLGAQKCTMYRCSHFGHQSAEADRGYEIIMVGVPKDDTSAYPSKVIPVSRVVSFVCPHHHIRIERGRS